MDHQEVNIVKLELMKGILHRSNRPLVALVFFGDFSGHEQFFPGDAQVSEGLPNLGFVLVELGGVKQPVAGLVGSINRRRNRLLAGNFIEAEPFLRHLLTIGKG